MEYIIDSTPHNYIVILGADIQGPLGPLMAHDDPLILGEFVMGNRGWKGDRFLRLLYAFNMHLPHTFVKDFDKAYTCINNGRSVPKQMDYMATTVNRKWITKASRLDCDAAQSDHWPLVLSLLPKKGEQRVPEKTQTPSKKMIGWKLTELTYNDTIRERLGMEAPLYVAAVNLDAHHIYTDGSFTGFTNVDMDRWRGRAKRREQQGVARVNVAIAGWAAVFFAKGEPPKKEEGQKPEWFGGAGDFGGVIRGRVVTFKEAKDAKSGTFVGAEILSNNTAEMQAVIETLMFLLAQVEQAAPVVELGAAVVIHSDSKYVIELITHGSRPTTNIVMRDFLSHPW